MLDSLIEALRSIFSKEVIVFIVSMLPVVELRGGLIAASALAVPLSTGFIISFIGNMLPIPFILIFVRRIFDWLRTKKRFARLVEKLEAKAVKKSESVTKYKMLGLFIFVAIPLPGTGAWTGALIAAMLDMRLKNSLPMIALGVLTAGIIVALLTYGLPALLR